MTVSFSGPSSPRPLLTHHPRDNNRRGGQQHREDGRRIDDDAENELEDATLIGLCAERAVSRKAGSGQRDQRKRRQEGASTGFALGIPDRRCRSGNTEPATISNDNDRRTQQRARGLENVSRRETPRRSRGTPAAAGLARAGPHSRIGVNESHVTCVNAPATTEQRDRDDGGGRRRERAPPGQRKQRATMRAAASAGRAACP